MSRTGDLVITLAAIGAFLLLAGLLLGTTCLVGGYVASLRWPRS